jgi:crotonobetainyl-CoA:carnitine CoA-transferase CaiB-like acyl-CoA transferase
MTENDRAGALTGVRVLDLSGPLGAYCSKLLADLGADVIKVEPPAGDPMRRRPPYKDDRPHPEGSLWFAYYHENKRGITLDLTQPAAASLVRELAGAADVVIVTPDPTEADGLDRRWDEWSHGELIVCAVTPYGLTGPYRDAPATHFTTQAMGSVMVSPGAEQPALPIPDQQMYDHASTHAVVSILVALRERPRAHGQVVEISAHEVSASQSHTIQRFALAGVSQLQSAGVILPPAGTWPCADGEIDFQVWDPRHWTGFVELLGNPPELGDPALQDRIERGRHVELIHRVVTPILAGRKKNDLVERGQALGVPCAAVNQPAEFALDKHTEARGFFIRTTHPFLGDYLSMGPFFRSEQPLAMRRRPAPLLGEHNHEVYVDQLGHTVAELDEWKEASVV